jgi:hypothetical protein
MKLTLPVTVKDGELCTHVKAYNDFHTHCRFLNWSPYLCCWRCCLFGRKIDDLKKCPECEAACREAGDTE